MTGTLWLRARSRTPFSEWWRTIDRLTLAALGALMLGGIVLCLAASPPVAARIGLDPFHFVNRQVLFLIPATAVLIATSFLSPREIRKLALFVFIVSLVLVAATPYFGAEIKGARRWLVILGMNIQPSEFLKPAFVDPDRLAVRRIRQSAPICRPTPSRWRCSSSWSRLLVLQPDFGQTMLVTLVWGALFYMAGMRFIWVLGLAATAGIGLVTAFYTVPHVAQRINRFLDPASGDTFNIDIATESFHPRRLVRPRPRRGHDQAHPARRPYRFRVRGGGGGIRRRALPYSGRFVRVHRHPRADQGDAQRRSVHPLRRRRARDPVRAAIGHQHGGQSASDAGQGNDAAVHLLRRLVADLARLRHGHADRADPRTAARASLPARSCSPRARRDDTRRAGRRSWSRPAARAAICFRPRRWRRRWRSAASPCISPPTGAPPAMAARLPKILSTLSPARRCAGAIRSPCCRTAAVLGTRAHPRLGR